MEKEIRLLMADEIECRAASVNENGVSILLYKDARVDQRILDETFGMFGWKRSHQCIDGSLYCTVEVYDRESGCWIAKQDVGTAGSFGKEKSQASDSFKRACFNWGIGRELYTAPFIWVPSGEAEIGRKDGKYYCSSRFCVSSIGYNGCREITSLTVINNSRNGKAVFQFRAQDRSGRGDGNTGKTAPDSISAEQISRFQSELQRTGVGIDAVKNRYGFHELQDMPEELYKRVMKALAKTKSAGGAA